MTATLHQPWRIADLSLAELLKQGRAATRDQCMAEMRLAILGDCATQHYSQCVAAALKLPVLATARKKRTSSQSPRMFGTLLLRGD